MGTIGKLRRSQKGILVVAALVVAAIGFAAGIAWELFAPRSSGGTVRSGGAIRSGGTDFPGGTVRSAAATPVASPIVPLVGPSGDGRIRGEFENKEAILLGVNELVQFHARALGDIVAAIHDRVRLIGVVANQKQQDDTVALLKANNLPPTAIEFFLWPVEAMWVRDYVPYFLVGKQVTVVDFTYSEVNRDLEDVFGMAVAAKYGFRYDHSHLTMEGGNLFSNGSGVCISTTRLIQLNASRGYNEQKIGELLHDHFHFNRWIRLQQLDGEPTGHADMFLTLIAPNKCVVGLYKPDQDAVNSRILDENASILQGEQTGRGPMEVVRIPMPSHADGNWRSYTNVIFANDALLVPQYPSTDRELDAAALRVFREALPDWKVIGIDCDSLIKKRGALHCISRQLPLLKNPAAGAPTAK